MRSHVALIAILPMLLLVGCEGDGAPEFRDQGEAIARHGPSMKAALKRHPARRFIDYYEPGWIPDVPHDLIYDPTDHDVSRVIALFRASNQDTLGLRQLRKIGLHQCDITGERVAPDFFDLTVDCY